MGEMLDIVKGLVSPAEKLIDVVASGCGKVYEPTNIRRTAKARAEELEVIGNQITNVLYLPTKYENGKIIIDTSQQGEMLLRAQQRFLFQESEKQQNIDAVVAIAHEELIRETEVSQESVDKDWVLRFFNSVEDISNEDMQKLWGKILAGEIKQPKTFSFRTMERVKNLTHEEAKIAEKVFGAVVHNKKYGFFVHSYKEYLTENNIDVSDIVLLQDCQLISSSNNLKFNIPLHYNQKKGKDDNINYIDLNGTEFSFISNRKGKALLNIPNYKLSKSGEELIKLINFPKENSLSSFVRCLCKKYDFVKISNKENH